MAITDVYFIEEGICSLTADTSDGSHVEVGITGRDGLVGITAILNPDAIAVHRSFIQMQGSGFRCNAGILRQAISQSTVLRDRCSRYLQIVMLESAQTAACNARHTLPERLARWLLTVRDKVDTDTLPLTHEFLSIMLGVRRAGVTLAANTLQAGGLIRQLRGRVIIIDRDRLEEVSCDCYRVMQDSRKLISAQRREP
jgi:CRP-like cAMP-binding protein